MIKALKVYTATGMTVLPMLKEEFALPHYAETLLAIADEITANGCIVVAPWIYNPSIPSPPIEQVVEMDLAQLKESHVCILEATYPSWGAGFEACCTTIQQITSLTLYRRDFLGRISGFAIHNPRMQGSAVGYVTIDEACGHVRNFLQKNQQEVTGVGQKDRAT